jgi:peptidoglycan/LPS O-acetylase OafA/YrhL
VVTHAYRARILTGRPFKRYFSLRLGRLYPVHLFAHLVYAANILGKWLIHRAGFGASNPANWVNTPSFFINLCLFQAFGLQDYLYWNRPSWSISSELVTYVVFFVLTLTCDRRPRIVPLLVGVGALYAVLLSWPSRHLNYTYDFGLLRCVAGFYLGSALYRLRARMALGQSVSGQSTAGPSASGPSAWRWSWTPARRTLAELGCLGAVALCVSHAALGSLWLAGAIAAFAASILVFSSRSNGAIGALLEGKPLRTIGVWSYSIYLLHLVWLEFAADLLTYGFGWDLKHGLGLKAWLVDAAVLGVVLVFARWTHEHIEEPLRKRVRLYAMRPEPSALALSREPARAL